MSSAAPAEHHVPTGSAAASHSAALTHAATPWTWAKHQETVTERMRVLKEGRLVMPYSKPVPDDPYLERRLMWEADPATRFNPTPPASTCDCIMCQIRSPHDLPVMDAFAEKTFRQRCGRRRTALLSGCALGDETMAAMLVEPTTTAGALDAVGCDGCSALWWAESRGMHAVAQSLRDSGATAGRRPALELCRGEADAADVDMKGQTVEFSGSCATLRSAERCRLGKRKYWELQVLAIESNSRLRCGATSSLGSMFSASDTGLGDDPQSWAVNGLARVFMHKGEKQDYKCAPWKEGDVIGIACDLVQMQMRVSLNGNFAAPDGAVFELDPEAVGEGLFAAFSAHTGMVRFNLGASFKFAPPSDEFAAFDDGITPVSADDHQEDDEPPSVDEISKRCAHGCPWMGWRHVKAALGVLEATGRITPKEADRAYDDACWQGHNFRRADRNKKIGVWLQALKDAEKDQEAARQREAVAKANPPQRPRIVKNCPHGKQAYYCQVFACPFVAVARVRAIELFIA